ncbi:MAG: CotH kinase family protein [Planctomycetes bacterium]|nr:CotH kinase family protein [Planctomycetota bacterium]
MSRMCLRSGILLLLATLPLPPAGAVVISEFMASNERALVAEDGSTPDWIEVYNDGAETVDLFGWALTDDRGGDGRWFFPERLLAPGEFLVVFASGKNKRDPAGELHTDFQLAEDGEYLGLRDRRGNVICEFFPRYPQQIPDASYGRPMEIRSNRVIPDNATARFLIPADDSLGMTWTEADFDDAAWTSGPLGIGYDQNTTPTFTGEFRTDVGARMRSVNASIYVRIPFSLGADDLDGTVHLRMRFADGFIAYINGVEVWRDNARAGDNDYDARAASNRLTADALIPKDYRMAGLKDVLRAGTNVLAFHAMNSSRTTRDFLLAPEMEISEVISVSPDDAEYYSEPTPGAPNVAGIPMLAMAPVLSEESGTRTNAFQLEMTAPAGGEIRYTLDSSRPTADSTPYTGPLSINATTMVRARVFQDGLLPSPTVSRHFVFVRGTKLPTFSSNLPIVLINTNGNAIPDTGFCGPGNPAHFYFIDRGPDGRAHIDGEPDFAGYGAIKRRGSSTGGDAKASYRIEMQDEFGEDRAIDVLGFPRESDFILYAPYRYDPALMRNAFIYEVSRRCGRWAARCRFVEVFVNTSRTAISYESNYMGCYHFMETIKRDLNRVDIAELLPDDEEEPEVSGGYVFKIDRPNPCEAGFSAGGQSFQWWEPESTEVTTAQRTWLTNYLNQANTAVQSRDIGRYEQYLDVDSWIDHHILNVFPKNVDAFRLSGYWIKDREKRIEAGPIWDYDRSMGSTDGRDINPLAWANTGGDGGTSYFTYGWYGPLFGNVPPTGDSEWARRYRARWRELRAGPLDTDLLLAIIDRNAAEIGEAATREYQRWSWGGSFQTNVNSFKNWIRNRVEWIDSQFIEPPILSHPGGLVPEDFELSMSSPDGEIYYTINGPDPRNGSNPAPEALRYEGPILLANNMKIQARTYVSRTWSELVSAAYYTYLQPLVITEVMYNPPTDPDGAYASTDFEYIEVLNIGTEEVDLAGVRLVGRITFDFSDGAVPRLGPGEYVVIARNVAALAYRYGDGIRVAGAYSGILSNSTMTLDLAGPADEPLTSFTYYDNETGWYPETDGGGYSLVIRDPYAPRETWDDPASWRASLAEGGSPGREDTAGGLQLTGDFTQNGRLTISDAVGMLYALSGSPAVSYPCPAKDGNRRLLDFDGDGHMNSIDAIRLLMYLFRDGDPPPAGLDCIPIGGCPDVCGGR